MKLYFKQDSFVGGSLALLRMSVLPNTYTDAPDRRYDLIIYHKYVHREFRILYCILMYRVRMGDVIYITIYILYMRIDKRMCNYHLWDKRK